MAEQTGKILIVNDKPQDLSLYTDFLKENHPNFNFLSATNGQEALDTVNQEYPDLILMDLELPIIDGMQALKQIKGDNKTRHIPIILLTEDNKDELLKEAFDQGAADFIKKPISKIEIQARVAMVLRLQQSLRRSDDLLLKVFPQEVAEELKVRNEVFPRYFAQTSTLFADIKGFSTTARKMKDQPYELLKKLDDCFEQLDDIAQKYKVERIKTMGDCYMAVSGISVVESQHAIRMTLMALSMQNYMNQNQLDPLEETPWQIRIGINSGDLIAGIIGKNKFAYDVWGDSINLAARMESTGEVGRVHISGQTYELIKDYFVCEKRDERVMAKNIGEIQTYFVNRIHPDYSADELGKFPNGKLEALLK